MAVFTSIGAAIFGAGTFLAGVTAAGLQIAAGVAVSLIGKAMQGEPQGSRFGVQGQVQTGDDVPRSILFGWSCTAGSKAYQNEWGSGGTMSTRVLALTDYPIRELRQVIVDGAPVTLLTGQAHAQYGWPVQEYRKGGKDHLWIKFYDGTQTAADSFLVNTVSSPERPYSSSRVGRGIPYVIATSRAPERSDDAEKPLFQGFPQFKFASYGARLYDPSRDSSVGGNGTQRWNNPATWGGDGDFLPPVQIYNLLRGIRFNGQWLYGLQNTHAARVPVANWIAAINRARATSPTPDGNEPTFRAGGEVQVGAPVHIAIEAFVTACNGRIAETGGTYKLHVGEPGAPVMAFDDGDIISTDEQSFAPFYSLADTVNGVSASYPLPEKGWNTKTAPKLLRPDLEATDGNRRLLASLVFDMVPYTWQVQRLMAWALAEALRARRHTFVLGPEFRVLEPGDVVRWTSARNYYENKLFRVDGIVYKSNLDVIVDLTEVDPSDYDPDITYRPVYDGPLQLVGPQPMPMQGWQVFPAQLRDADGRGRRPSIEVRYASGVADVARVRVRVRLAGEAGIVFDGELPYGDPWAVILAGQFLPNTDYEVQGIFIRESGSPAEWSAWLPVTTPNILFDASLDILDDSITSEKIRDAAITADKLMDEAVTNIKLADEAVTTSKIAVEAITNELLAPDSVTNGKIAAAAVTADELASGAVTHDKIVAGAVYGDVIAAGSITARELVLTDFQNIITNGQFDQGEAGWIFSSAANPNPISVGERGGSGGGAAQATAPATHLAIFQQSDVIATTVWTTLIPATEGEHFLLSIDVASGGSDWVSNYQFIARQFGADGSTQIGNVSNSNSHDQPSWINFSWTYTAQADVKYVRFEFRRTGGVGVLHATNFRVQRKNNANLIVDGAITAGKLAAGSVTTEKLQAGAVTAEKIQGGTITGDKIAGNTITGDLLVANSITARSLVVTDFTNLVTNGTFNQGFDGWEGAGYSIIQKDFGGSSAIQNAPTPFILQATQGNGQNTYIWGARFPAVEGDQFWFSFDHAGGGAPITYRWNFPIRWYDANNSIITTNFVTIDGGTTTWSTRVASLTAPAGAAYVRIEFRRDGTIEGSAFLTNIQFRRKASANLIVDGAITAGKLAANAVTAGKINAGAINTSNLIVNGVVVTDKIGQNAVTSVVDTYNVARVTHGSSWSTAATLTINSIDGKVVVLFSCSVDTSGNNNTGVEYRVLRGGTVIRSGGAAILSGNESSVSICFTDSGSPGSVTYQVQGRNVGVSFNDPRSFNRSLSLMDAKR